MKIRHAYSPSEGGKMKPKGKSLTRQSFKDETDVNQIIERHRGPIPVAQFTDEIIEFPENFSYHEALNAVNGADEAFLTLPADLRAAHDNDPGRLIAHLESESYLSGTHDAFGVEITAESDSAPFAEPEPAEPASTVPT